jgi:hypothetical protein
MRRDAFAVAHDVGCCCIAAAFVALLPSTTAAQRAASGPGVLAAGPRVVGGTRADDDGADRETAPVIIADGAPRTFQVVTVPVPVDIPTDRTISYNVIPVGNAPLLGQRRGTITRAGSGVRSVVLTVGVPAFALGGRTTVAYVRFVAEGVSAVRVPVELEIRGIPHVLITPAQNLRGAQPGEQLELRYQITNAGNLRDSFDLRVDAPPTWNPRFAATSHLVMAAGETVDRTVRIVIPIVSDIGDFPVILIASTAMVERARATTVVEVTDMARMTRRSGPVATVGAASALSEGSSTQTIETISINGPLSDGVTVNGRFSTPVSDDAVATRAFSTMGYSSRSNFISLSAQHWGAAVGTTGLHLNELAGQTVFGRGASAQLKSDRVQLRTLSASPFTTAAPVWSSPTLLAASADVHVGPGVLSAFFAHLRDSSYMVRSLDVAGVGVEATPWRQSLVSAQVAERQYADGSGLGAAGEVRGPLAGGDLDLRVVHAPGGSAAFASTRDAYSASGGRTFGRLRTDASYWGTQDKTATTSDITTTGWSASPSYSLFAPLTIGVDVRRSSFVSSDVHERFGSSQQEYGGRLHFLHGGFDLSADTRWSAVTRDAASPGGAAFSEDSRRLTHRARLDHLGPHGAIGIGGSIEAATSGAVAIPAPTTADVHIEQLQLLPRVPGLTLSGAVQRMQYGQAVLTTSRAELALEIRRSMRLVLGGEKGIVRDAKGTGRSVITLRVERMLLLPSFSRRVTGGVVFLDRNGNGRRDAGEQGVAGIVVHRGSESAVSDSRGVFHISNDSYGRAEIDSRSLPEGWLQSPRLLDEEANERELGVVPTTALEIRVALAPLADGTIPNARIGRATLVLRDSTGREWVAETGNASRLTFDALPAGRYTLDMQLTGSSEPLLVDAIPPVEVGATPGRQHLTVLARTRPVRIFRPRVQEPPPAPSPERPRP